MKALKNATVYVEGKGLIKTNLAFGTHIESIGGDVSWEEIIPLPEDAVVLPSFIDVHVHGASGADTMDASEESLSTIAKELAKEGTGAFLATTMTQESEIIKKSLRAARDYRTTEPCEGAELLGIHLEGPFLSEVYCGAQPKEFIKDFSTDLFDEFQNECGGAIKLTTVAPEKEGATEFIKHLTAEGVSVSVGHSAASEADMQAAIEAGVSSVTHTYNGQSPLHHRDLGVVGSALLYDALYAELIADGLHVSIPAMKLLIKSKPQDKLVLITDAMRGKGLGDGESELGGQKVTLRGNEARLENGALAGSVLKMNVALKNLVTLCGLSFCDAVDAATANPAKLLGLYHQRGSISLGKRADFTVLDREFNVLLTVRFGKIIYKAY